MSTARAQNILNALFIRQREKLMHVDPLKRR